MIKYVGTYVLYTYTCMHVHIFICSNGKTRILTTSGTFQYCIRGKEKGTRDLKTGNQEVKRSLFAEVITISLEH